jgi:hypothetical protein
MNFLKRFWKEVPQGAAVPSGWRMAWYEPRRQVGVYTAMPLHWIARMLREFRYRVSVAITAPRIEQDQAFQLQRTHRDRERLAEEYSKGYLAGWRECFEACLQAVEEEITDADELWKMGAALTGSTTTQSEN